LVKYDMTVSQVAKVYGVAVDNIERILRQLDGLVPLAVDSGRHRRRQKKSATGGMALSGREIMVGDHSPHGRGIALSGFKSLGRLPTSTFGETSTVHVNWSRTRRTGVRRFRP
jgi:hypothetical protein